MTKLSARVQEYYSLLDSRHAIPRHICSPDMLIRMSGVALGIDDADAFGEPYYRAFPDLTHSVIGGACCGNHVTSRLLLRGTHMGPLGDFPASGVNLCVSAMVLHRFDGDLLAEQWVESDQLGLLRQIGAWARGN